MQIYFNNLCPDLMTAQDTPLKGLLANGKTCTAASDGMRVSKAHDATADGRHPTESDQNFLGTLA